MNGDEKKRGRARRIGDTFRNFAEALQAARAVDLSPAEFYGFEDMPTARDFGDDVDRFYAQPDVTRVAEPRPEPARRSPELRGDVLTMPEMPEGEFYRPALGGDAFLVAGRPDEIREGRAPLVEPESAVGRALDYAGAGRRGPLRAIRPVLEAVGRDIVEYGPMAIVDAPVVQGARTMRMIPAGLTESGARAYTPRQTRELAARGDLQERIMRSPAYRERGEQYDPLQLKHYGPRGVYEPKLDPAFQGTGPAAGRERARTDKAPHTYFYVPEVVYAARAGKPLPGFEYASTVMPERRLEGAANIALDVNRNQALFRNSPEFAELVEEARAAGHMGDAEIMRYVEQVGLPMRGYDAIASEGGNVLARYVPTDNPDFAFMRAIREHGQFGGSTIDPVTGANLAKQPGYAVGMARGNVLELPYGEELLPYHFRMVERDYPGATIGSWLSSYPVEEMSRSGVRRSPETSRAIAALESLAESPESARRAAVARPPMKPVSMESVESFPPPYSHVLDPVMVVPDFREAAEIARRNQQEAFFDLGKMEEVKLKDVASMFRGRK